MKVMCKHIKIIQIKNYEKLLKSKKNSKFLFYLRTKSE